MSACVYNMYIYKRVYQFVYISIYVNVGDIDDGEGDGDEDVPEDVETGGAVDGPGSVALGPIQTVPKRFSEAGGSSGHLTMSKVIIYMYILYIYIYVYIYMYICIYNH
jgi:hypothetical protein